MSPGVVWERLAGCFLAGVLLGPAVDLLRPLHRRLPVLTQILMALDLTVCWLYTSFGLCRGELQMGCYMAVLAGLALWETFFGRAAASFFGLFWQFALFPLKISLKFFRRISNFLFPSWKKWSTIGKNNRLMIRRRSGGKTHGANPILSQPLSASVPPHPHPEQGCGGEKKI